MVNLGTFVPVSSQKQKLDSSSSSTRGVSSAQSLPATLTPGGVPSGQEVRAVLGERRDQYAAAMRHAKTQRSTAKAQEFGKMAARFSKVGSSCHCIMFITVVKTSSSECAQPCIHSTLPALL